MSASASAIKWAESIREKHASNKLSRVVARLYSHHTQIRAGQAGLTSWGDTESRARLDEAVLLIDAGLTLREGSKVASARDCLRRAGELLEWLPPSTIADATVSNLLLSAAAYQLAGYPARAFSILKSPLDRSHYSNILRAFLRGRFHEVEGELLDYWTRFPRAPFEEEAVDIKALDRLIVDETIASFGLTVAYARWGEDERLDAALEKLDAVQGMLVRGSDQTSWLLSKLTAAFARDFVATSLRRLLSGWAHLLSEDGRHALERYVRLSFVTGRCQAWPSQRAGFDRLSMPGSFALCTPTGSGKTRVAEIAILQAVFGDARRDDVPDRPEPIAIYLVPSRALAAEVEGKMSRVFKRLSKKRVVITGLYGGTDWGPADAWLTSPDPALLICTYEKAEALMRFLGPQFMSRVALVVLDEAHSVRFDQDYGKLGQSESRAFRLEALGMRLLQIVKENKARVVALSAVATGIEQQLQSWVTDDDNTKPVSINYRSTRQLIGRLLINESGQFEVRYDLLDGSPLQFRGSSETPYVQNTIPRCPPADGWDNKGPDVSLRPALLWAAMHLARDVAGVSRGVMISVTQHLGVFARDCLELLTVTWATERIPNFFRQPETTEHIALYARTQQACADIFGRDSAEYQLLDRGIVMHHGKMPTSLGRLLVELVDEGVINLVMATSTLSEGVNLPLEVVLIQSLLRSGRPLSESEFGNLAGRAGRPGVSSEGQTLVLLKQPEARNQPTWNRYNTLISAMQARHLNAASDASRASPLAELLRHLRSSWEQLSNSSELSDFHHWLETTAVDTARLDLTGEATNPALDALDTLDSLLLAIVVEHEQAGGSTSKEEELTKMWRSSFAAHVASLPQLEDIFLRRGAAIGTSVYADHSRRSNLYRTGLPPRSGAQLLDIYDELREAALPGADFARWSRPQQFEYVKTIVGLVGQIKRFELGPKASSQKVKWQQVLAWWMDPAIKPYDPGPNRRADWFKYVNHHFYYLFSWGIGSFIGVASARSRGSDQSVWELKDWVRTGLPWSVFWLKDLVSWGTLDPAAAYILSKGAAHTRIAAQSLAKEYYTSDHAVSVQDPLDPRVIRKWFEATLLPLSDGTESRAIPRSGVSLDDDFSDQTQTAWRVYPVQTPKQTHWIDPAGYRLATSSKPTGFDERVVSEVDFILNSQSKMIEGSLYL